MSYVVRPYLNKHIRAKTKTECQSDTGFTLQPDLRSNKPAWLTGQVKDVTFKGYILHPSRMSFRTICEWCANGVRLFPSGPTLVVAPFLISLIAL